MLQYLYFEESSLIEPPQKEKLTVEDRKPTYNLILMKTQSSVWTWTLDFDLGFVKKNFKTSLGCHQKLK